MQKHTVAIIGLGRMGSTIDDEGHGDMPYSVAAATRASGCASSVKMLTDQRPRADMRMRVMQSST